MMPLAAATATATGSFSSSATTAAFSSSVFFVVGNPLMGALSPPTELDCVSSDWQLETIFYK